MYSRQKAIKECYLLWRILHDNGDYSKEPSLSLLYRKGLLSLASYEFNCPLCEYTRKKTGQVNCTICPIKWPILKKYKEDHAPNPCLNSYFAIWRFGDKNIRKTAARAIVKLFGAQYPSVIGGVRKQYDAGHMSWPVNRKRGLRAESLRDGERIPLSAPVRLHGEAHHTPTEAELINISLEGAYLTTRDSLPVGHTCKLEVILPGEKDRLTINIRGTTIRRDKGGLGIRFHEALDPTLLKAILSKGAKSKKAADETELS